MLFVLSNVLFFNVSDNVVVASVPALEGKVIVFPPELVIVLLVSLGATEKVLVPPTFDATI